MNQRTPIRATATTQSANRTIVIDIKQHFPAYREYRVHTFADALRATLKRPVLLRCSY